MTALCDQTCLTCSDSLFNSCLSCAAGRILVNGVCECAPFSSTQCSNNPVLDFYEPFQVVQSFFTLYVVTVATLYVLNVRLKYTYRIFSLFQMCSYALNMSVYFEGEAEYFLRIMYRTNGGYLMAQRFSTFSLQNTACVGITLSVIVLLYFSQYWVAQAYIDKDIKSYGDYLLKYLYKLLESVYFLEGKYLILYLTQTILFVTTSNIPDLTLGPAMVFMLLIVLQLFYSIYAYKQGGELHPVHYPRHFSLYLAMSPLSLIVLPILKSYGFVVYLIPIGLLILILLVGREEKFDRWVLVLYASEVVFCCLPLGIIFIGSRYVALYCLVLWVVLTVLSVVECGLVFYSSQLPTQRVQEQDSKAHSLTVDNLNDTSIVEPL